MIPSVTHTVVWSSKNGIWTIVRVQNTHETPARDYIYLDNNNTGYVQHPFRSLAGNIMLDQPEAVPAYVLAAIDRNLPRLDT